MEQSRLLSHVRDVAKIPCDDVIDRMKRSQRDVDGIANKIPMEYPAIYVALRKYRHLVIDRELPQTAV